MSAFPRREGVPTRSVGTRGAGAERGNEGRRKQKAFPRRAWERGKRGRAEDEGVPTQSVHGKEGIPTQSVGTREAGAERGKRAFENESGRSHAERGNEGPK
ncbi:MAG: hypothetical protein DRH50_15075 [Deltaproteobacteria bacterium]|nr:MAG: hypothetical protein DRH50_15075 [Deltaproteobacteria bacterium]